MTKTASKRKKKTSDPPPQEIQTDWGWALRLLGVLLLIVAAFVYFDPLAVFQENPGRSLNWIEIVLGLVAAVLGPTATAVVLAVFGVLSLLWGIVLWFRRKPPAQPDSQDPS